MAKHSLAMVPSIGGSQTKALRVGACAPLRKSAPESKRITETEKGEGTGAGLVEELISLNPTPNPAEVGAACCIQ